MYFLPGKVFLSLRWYDARGVGLFVSVGDYPTLKGTSTNETRLGAVKDIELGISEGKIDDDLLVMAGDNLLSFSLERVCEVFRGERNDLHNEILRGKRGTFSQMRHSRS